jgi:hypothetical protein
MSFSRASFSLVGCGRHPPCRARSPGFAARLLLILGTSSVDSLACPIRVNSGGDDRGDLAAHVRTAPKSGPPMSRLMVVGIATISLQFFLLGGVCTGYPHLRSAGPDGRASVPRIRASRRASQSQPHNRPPWSKKVVAKAGAKRCAFAGGFVGIVRAIIALKLRCYYVSEEEEVEFG